MPSTHDRTAGSNALPLGSSQGLFKISNIIDANDFTLASGDTVQCLDIPAKTYVKNVFVEVVTPAVGNTATATVGDGAGANSFDASTNLAAAAATITFGAEGTDAYATSGKVYSAADTIDLVVTLGGALTTQPVFKVTALCVDLSV